MLRIARKLSDCKNCALNGQTKVRGICSISKPVLAICGEAPDREEAEEGTPFVGAAGTWQRNILYAVDLTPKSVYFFNAINCRPPGGKIDNFEGEDAFEKCAPGFQEELATLVKLGVTMFVPIGTTALNRFGIPGGIMKNRGSIFVRYVDESGSIWESSMNRRTGKTRTQIIVIPTYQPSFIMKGNVKEEPTWSNDWKKIKRLVKGGYTPPKEDFILFPTVSQVTAFAERVVRDKTELGCDIEASSLNTMRAEIYVLSFADSNTHTISIPFYKKGKQRYWSKEDEPAVIRAVRLILAKCPIIFQNALYDFRILEYNGFPVGNIAHDTMLLHHAIHPELPHNLGYITSVYGITPYWKDLVLNSESSMMGYEDAEFRTYNCRDSVTLKQNTKPMLADLKSSGTAWIYENISMPLIRPIAQMMDNGMGFNQNIFNAAMKTLKKSHTRMHKAIFRDYPLSERLNLHSSQDLAFIFYGLRPAKFRTALKKLDEYEENPRKKKDSKAFRELTALKQTFAADPPFILPRTMGKIPTTDTGLPAVAEDDIVSLQIAASNRLRDIARLRRITPDHATEKARLELLLAFIKDHRTLTQIDKVISTYGFFPVEADGRVHFQFKIHGTNTGRLSSGGKQKKGSGYEKQFPGNAQNIPMKGPGKIIRKAFVADAGNLLVELDYSNLELRVIAYLSKDEMLIAIFAEGLNIHSENCRILFKIDPSHPLWTIARRAAKVYIFGRNYGGTLRGVFRKVAKEVPELGLTFDRFCEADTEYRRAHPKYAKWYDGIIKEVEKTRTITNAFGRKRYLLGPPSSITREGLNTPVQGTAADIVSQRALIPLPKVSLPTWRMILTTHDSVMFEIPEQDLLLFLDKAKSQMQAPIEVNGYKVSFPVDAKIGRNWYDMVEEEKWFKKQTKSGKTGPSSSTTTVESPRSLRRRSTRVS